MANCPESCQPDERLYNKAKEIEPNYIWELNGNSTTRKNGKIVSNCWYFVADVLDKFVEYWRAAKWMRRAGNRADVATSDLFCQVKPSGSEHPGDSGKPDLGKGDIVEFNGVFSGSTTDHIAFVDYLRAKSALKDDYDDHGEILFSPSEWQHFVDGSWQYWNGDSYSLYDTGGPSPFEDFRRQEASFGNVLYRKPNTYSRPISPVPPPEKRKKAPSKIITDPVVLDLNGDGIQTVGLDAHIIFDYDANGFIERTGWVAPGDGILLLDMDGNGMLDTGNELFSDFTVLHNGMNAENGFQALACYDFNGDGRIDPDDPIWSQLRIWQDNTWSGDVGYYGDPDVSGTTSTLDDLGLRAIYLNSDITNRVDSAGNTEVRSGHFEWNDGRIGNISEYSFQRDTGDTLADEYLEVPPEIAALPNLSGHGNVYSLHQAMVRDSSGELAALSETFANEKTIAGREAILSQLMFKWAGADSVATDARRPFMDGREVVFLENYYGDPPANPDAALAVSWKDTFRTLFETFYSTFMSQTHLSSLFHKLIYTADEESGDSKADFREVIPDLVESLNADSQKGKELLSEFARTLRGSSSCSPGCYLTFREYILEIDPSLGWVFDTGGLPVYNQLGQSPDGWYYRHMFGTWQSDAVQGCPTQGDGWINSLTGDDVVYGTERGELLFNQDGDALLVAGGGYDLVWAGEGNDIIDGGEGYDILYGAAGNDTYIFRRCSGTDTIIDEDAIPGNIDTIWLGSNLTPDDIALKRVYNNLVLRIVDTSDSITVRDFFRNNSTLNRVERIQFMDGTTWDETTIIEQTNAPSNGPNILYGGPDEDQISGLGGDDYIVGMGSNDTLHGDDGQDRIYGSGGSDTLEGGAGADRLFGEEGADTLVGGPDDDYLDGGLANDTYRFGPHFGQDTILDIDTTPGNIDIIQFEEGVLPTDVQLRRSADDLKVSITGTGDTITVQKWLENDSPVHGIEMITFADGTTWDTETIQDMLVAGSEGRDYLFGFSRADTMEGFGSDDTLDGRGGDDTIVAGTGNDRLFGEDGNDTLVAGDGADTLVGGFGADYLVPGSGDDRLYGGDTTRWSSSLLSNGNDTYFYDIGYGRDVILDQDRSAGNLDTIRFGDDIAPDDIKLTRCIEDLILSIDGTNDTLTVEKWFWNDSPEYRVEQVAFADGTTWDIDDIKYQVIQGTPGDDSRTGYSTSDTMHGYEGNDQMWGRDGDDVLDAGQGNDWIEGEAGSDTLLAGYGDDTLVGGSGDDTFDPGAGRDVMYGGSRFEYDNPRFNRDASNGNDTYRFGRHYERDTVYDRDATQGNHDTILLNDDVSTGDVLVRQVGDDLVLSINGTTDKLTVHKWFSEDSSEWQVEEIRFADGTSWDVDAIKQMTLQGTPGDDVLRGYATADTIVGYAGSDKLFGNDGSDTLVGGNGIDELVGGDGADYLDGGADNDVLMGGLGNDEYRLGHNSGQDTVTDQDSTPGNLDAIVLDADITTADVNVRRSGDSLVVSLNGTTDSMTVENWFLNDSPEYQVEEIRFGDGTTWDVDTIKQMMLQGTPGDDLLRGYATDDTIVGYAGKDRLYGFDGEDYLDPGQGDDYMEGGKGSDRYFFTRGYGHDTVVDYDPEPGNIDTVVLGADVLPSDVSLKAGGNSLFLSINGTDDTLQLADWFSSDASKIEHIQFGDGTIWDTAMIQQVATTPSDADDYLVGSPDKDLIDGGGGNDYIEGRGNDDTLFGGPGQDQIYGQDANDVIYGGLDSDYLDGGSGDDRVFGEEGNDDLVAGSGSDYLDGGPGNDHLVAGSGDNHLVGGSGQDRLESGTGTNFLDGGADDDEIIADQGQNTILFNQGDGFDSVTSRLQSHAGGPVLVKNLTDVGLDPWSIQDVAAANGTLFFTTMTYGESYSDRRYHLWKSDGTEAGTVMVEDFASGSTWSEIYDLTDVDGTLFFTANDGIHGLEIWKSDGTEAGTVMVKDICPGAESSRDEYGSKLCEVAGTLFFSADDGVHGRELWKSDGTEAGTVMVKDINTEEGWNGPDSVPDRLTNVNDTLFFSAYDGVHWGGLWKSDGTEAGTVMVNGDIWPTSESMCNVNGTLFFVGDDDIHYDALWKSDGTETGTVLVKDSDPSGNWRPYGYSLIAVNNTLFFLARDDLHGRELWKSDGTRAGTAMVKDLWPGEWYTTFFQMLGVNDTLFFCANDGTNGNQLWKSDGTEAGTAIVTTAGTSSPDYPVNVNGTVFFEYSDGVHGDELWKTDGTETGTVMVADISSGSGDSSPAHLTNVNGTLYFTAYSGTGAYTPEGRWGLWKLDPGSGPSNSAEDTIRFGPGITPDDLSVQTRIGDLVSGEFGVQLLIGTGDGEGMLIEAASENGSTNASLSDLAIKTFAFDDGTVLSLDEILNRADGTIGYQEGTDGSDTLWGSVTSDEILGLGGNDAIIARDGNDYVGAGDGDDVIALGSGDDEAGGGPGGDVMAGERGRDYLYGDEDDDVYAFNRNDGQDYIDNTSSSGAGGVDTLSFGVSINPEDITAYIAPADPDYSGYGADLVLQIQDGSDQVKVWYFESMGGDITAAPLSRVQFIDANGHAQVFDLLGIVEALKSDLEGATGDNPVALFTEATAQFELTGTVGIAGGDHAVAYAQTGDLFAVPQYITGTSGDDTIQGSIAGDTIESGDGNDTISSGPGNDEIFSGDGADSVFAGDGNDVIDSGNGTDFIDAGPGDDVIRGLQGGDTALGGSGNDRYESNLGDGAVTIEDRAAPGEGNTIVFGDGITADSLTLVPGDAAMTIKVGGSGDEIMLQVFDGSDVLGNYAVETYCFADGTQLSFTDLVARGFDLEGTEGEDLLLGTSLNDHIIGLGGDDVIVAGPGVDRLEGGSGDDLYVHNLGDEVDTIVDAPVPGAGNSILFGQGISTTDITLGVDGDALVINVGSSGDALRLEGFNPDDPYNTVTVETFRFADGTVLSSTDLLNLGFTFEGTPDADTLTGTAARDLFIGHEGTDTLTGGLGDDTYQYSPGGGVDTIADESTLMDPNMLIFGEGITPDDITLSHIPASVAPASVPVSSLIMNIGTSGDAIHFTGFDASDPYGTHAVEYFQFSDGQIVTYNEIIDRGFDITGTPDSDNLSGTSTTDRITGSDGADSIAGGKGNDFLSGGLDDDRYFFDLGDGVDMIDDVATIDAGNTLVFGEGIEVADLDRKLTFRDGMLIIRIGENGDEVHLTGFDVDVPDVGPRAVQTFEFADGTILSYEELVQNTFIVQGGSADDDLTGTRLTDRLYGYEGSDRLQGGLGNDTLTGGTQSDELFGGDGGDLYVFNPHDGVDTIHDWCLPEAANMILFNEGITIDDISTHIDGTTLVIEYGAGDAINLLDYSYNGPSEDGIRSHVVETIEFADGMQVQLNSLVEPGTDGDDYILGSYFEDTINAKAGNDTVITFESNDTVYGGPGADTIDTGAGDDTIVSGPGNDSLTGGAGYDTYEVDLGDGVDTIIDDSSVLGEGNMIRFGDGIGQADIATHMEGTTLVIEYGTLGDKILLPNFDYNQENGSQVVGAIEFADGSDVRLAALLDPGTDGDDYILGSYFEDMIDAKAGSDTVITFESNDTIDAGPGNDTVDAGAGYDTITGGQGADSLTGGPGHDTYRHDLGDGVDTITDTATAYEGNVIEFGDGIAFDDLTLSYENDTLIVNVGENGDQLRLSGFDPEDAAGTHAVEIFRFADGSEKTYADLIAKGFDLIGTPEDDTIVGTNVADRIDGLAGNDVITSGAGDDFVNGGLGADAMAAGEGNDTYIVDDPGDVVTETPFEGIDTVQAMVDYILNTDVEKLYLTGSSAINGTGNALDNILLGNSATNILDGGAGADSMAGGQGDDTYIVDSESDTVEEAENEGTDTVWSTISYTLGSNLENLVLMGVVAIDGTGNELDNRITGNTAANVLTGGLGRDELLGGDGDDTYVFIPGDGVDTVTDTAGSDVIKLGQGIAPENIAVDIDAAGAHLRVFDIEGEKTGEGIDINLTAEGIPAVETIEFADGTTANIGDFMPRTVYGTNHADTIRTGNTSDTIYALCGSDNVSAGGNDDTVYGGNGSDSINGEAGNDRLFGENGSDELIGGSGSDFLDGGNGSDRLIGGPGDDTYVVDNPCEDVVENPNEGTDTVLSSVTYSLPANVEKLTLTGNSSVNATGNSSDNVLTGNSGNNTLSGGSGNDTLTGNAGRDRLFGGSGSDTYELGTGAGQDEIHETGSNASAHDVVKFTDVRSTGLTSVERHGNDLELRYGSGDRVTIEDQFKRGWGGYGIEEILFSDGVSWNRATIAAKAKSDHGCDHEWKSNETKAKVYNQVDLLVSAMAGFGAPAASAHTVIHHDDRRHFVTPLLGAHGK